MASRLHRGADMMLRPLACAIALLLAACPAGAEQTCPPGDLHIWGGDPNAPELPQEPLSDFRGMAEGGAWSVLAIRKDRTLAIFGDDPNNPIFIHGIPPELANERFSEAVLLRQHALALRQDGTIAAFSSTPPPAPGILDVPAGLRARSISGGVAHSAAVGLDGTLHIWGSPSFTKEPPAGVFTRVGGRTTYIVALREDGILFGWGGPPFASAIFAGWESDGAGHFYWPNETFVDVVGGNSHVLARRADGTVKGWGSNGDHELEAPPGMCFEQIAAGWGFSLGLDCDGYVRHWGRRDLGQDAVPQGKVCSIAGGAFQGMAIVASPAD
jgi:hypothetical protein